MTATSKTRALPRVLTISQRLVIGLTAMFMGTGMVFAVGLAQDERLHNAAHDTRHAIGFPCH